MSKERLDSLLFQLGYFDSRERAKAVIMSGNVYIDGKKAAKPGMQVSPDVSVEIRDFPKYVSRGGLKLEKALTHFGLSPQNKTCIDCGGGSGGFTDCLLQHGARFVYVVDVGYGQLAWSIRNDPRVVTMERTNIRNVKPQHLETRPELAVIDLSFISLALVLPVVRALLTDNSEAICLIKPQFEAGREKVGKKGVVRQTETHIEVLDAFLHNAAQADFSVIGITHSPIKGPEGNIEFLAYLRSGISHTPYDKINTNTVTQEAHADLGIRN